jgi:hypothetical protein
MFTFDTIFFCHYSTQYAEGNDQNPYFSSAFEKTFISPELFYVIVIRSCPRIMEALIFCMVMSTKAIECARAYAPMVIDSKVVAREACRTFRDTS